MQYIPVVHECKRYFNYNIWSSISGTACIFSRGNIAHYVWQSRVEIEHYSVAYFNRIAAFEAL